MHHHLIAAAAQSSLEKGSWTEGLIAFVIICLLVLCAGNALLGASIRRRRQRAQYQAQPTGQYGPQQPVDYHQDW